jgi:CheY-like chemotaxis protein
MFNSTSESGLGLYICKTLLKLHNGKISHEFIEPIGNKFIITIYLKKVKSIINPVFDISVKTDKTDKTDKTKKSENNVIKPPDNMMSEFLKLGTIEKNVLIVDDSTLTLKIMRNILLDTKIFDTITVVENGKEALEILKNDKNIIVVFIDKNMPVMDGFELALKIREQNYKNLLIGFTGDDSQETIESFKKHGVDYVLQKPLN